MDLFPALYYQKLPEGKVKCLLCPHQCIIGLGRYGNCRVRINQDGELFSTIYGKVSALHLDPIEKKPLYHFYPGQTILSLGTVGCNLRCNFCQNAEISQSGSEEVDFLREYDINHILSMAAMANNNIGIAFTYNEPGIWIEFMLEIAARSKARGLKNVMVTNGYIEKDPLRELTGCIDAFSVDLKGFSESFYERRLQGKLKPVLKTLEAIRLAGRHLEIVNLVIPGLNDDEQSFRRMVDWLAVTLGKETVLHLSAYHPRYLLNTPPTPQSTLNRMKTLAQEKLKFVYCGNIPGEVNNTYCPLCGNLLISRHNYSVSIQGLDQEMYCLNCKKWCFQNF